MDKFQKHWLGRILANAVESGEITPKQIARAFDVESVQTAYNWLSRQTIPSVEQLPVALANLPRNISSAILLYLESHQPAPAAADDDINQDGKHDHNDVEDYMLLAGQLDLSAVAALRSKCADGDCTPEEATEMLLKLNEVIPALQGAQRVLQRIANKFPRRSAAAQAYRPVPA